MKTWRVISTDADGTGSGESYQDRWLAEERFEAARKPGRLVILAEFQDNRMIEIVRDTRFEIVERKQA